MDYAATNVILLDDRVQRDRVELGECSPSSEPAGLLADIRSLLSVFNGVHVLSSGSACLTKVKLLDSVPSGRCPTFVFLPVTTDLKPVAASASVHSIVTTSALPQAPGDDNVRGLALLQHIALQISEYRFSKLIVPIAVIDSTQLVHDPEFGGSEVPNGFHAAHAVKCIETGAMDVISSPFISDRLHSMSTLAYRALVEAIKAQPKFLELKKARKRSWVGLDEEYAYMLQDMVSTLLEDIRNPENTASKPTQSESYWIPPDREEFVRHAIGLWGFPAHQLSDDELVHAGYLMFQHALAMPELKKWQLSSDDLKQFLMACRSAYNGFVLYHNFRHVIDVLQATFYSLVQIGTLPPYPPTSKQNIHPKSSPIAALLTPFEAFVLLVTAIGHDVGHPGVSNGFLVSLKAPLAQLYNDNSVLEAFHCAAYSQILRRYWPKAYNDTKVRSLLIKSILATDMALHADYMTDAGNLQQKLAHNKGTDGWSVKVLENYKALTCGLLIKCADISNVARPFDFAEKWAYTLQLEFASQAEIERKIGIETTLFGGPPELGNLTKLAASQIGFMSFTASPLFEAVADLLPGMKFAFETIKANQRVWQEKIEEEKSNEEEQLERERYKKEGVNSPRSGSPDKFSSKKLLEQSHPEGLPATGAKPQETAGPPMSTSRGIVDLTRQSSASTTNTSSKGPLAAGSVSEAKVVSAQHGLVSSAGRPSNIFLPPSKSQPPEDSPPLFHASSPNYAQQPLHSPMNGPRSSNSDHAPASARSYSGNFSRPMSHRHSANTSFARSSAPSGAPTVASTAFLPNSPTGTQDTSLFEGYGSDGGYDGPPRDSESERHGSGGSSSLPSGSGLSGSSAARTPRNEDMKPVLSSTGGVILANGHVFNSNTRVGGTGGASGGNGNGGGDAVPQREVRRKGSRFIEWWKKKVTP